MPDLDFSGLTIGQALYRLLNAPVGGGGVTADDLAAALAPIAEAVANRDIELGLQFDELKAELAAIKEGLAIKPAPDADPTVPVVDPVVPPIADPIPDPVVDPPVITPTEPDAPSPSPAVPDGSVAAPNAF